VSEPTVEPLLSVDQVARRLKLEEAVVKALAESGHLPAVRIGERWRIPPTGIDEFYARICRGEVPADCTPINGIILTPRVGASRGQRRQRVTPIAAERGAKRGAA
jgi:excisionase family DNA binding protein